MRAPIAEGRADFMPIFLSDIPSLFTSRQVPLDVALVQLSPPDRHGHCTLGTSVDAARAAVDSARYVIAGDQRADAAHPRQLVGRRSTGSTPSSASTGRSPRPCRAPETPVDARIGELIAALVEDGVDAAARHRRHPRRRARAPRQQARPRRAHRDVLAIGLIDLVEAGVVTNRFKKIHPGRIATSFVRGTRRLFDFVDDNLMVEFHRCDRTNDTADHPQEPQGGRHQLGHRGRPHRAGVRRLDRAPHLLGHRRADGLHARRGALARRASRSSPCRRPPRRGQGVAHRRRRSSRGPASSRRAGTCTGW